MGWEPRGDERYYYRKVRTGKHVASVYIGKGPLADFVANRVVLDRLQADEEREQRAELRELWSQVRERLDAVESAVRRLFGSLGADFRLAMNAAGCYCHKGEWRRRRASRMNPVRFLIGISPAIEAEKARRLFDRDDGSMIDRHRGDMARNVEETLIAHCSKEPLKSEAIRRNLADLRRELAGDSPTMIERILAERVALCWLDLHVTQSKNCEEMELAMIETTFATYCQRRLDRAQRRLIASCKSLAQFRSLALPTVNRILERTLLTH